MGCSVYEIYPQSETPQLIQIAHLDFDPSMDPPARLLPDKVIWYGFYEDKMVFRVWDFRVNHSISFFCWCQAQENKIQRRGIITNVSTRRKCELLTRFVWVGDYDEDSNHRLKWRHISMGHPSSITSTAGFFSITVPLIYHHSWQWHSRMTFHTTLNFFRGKQSLTGILVLRGPFISTFYLPIQTLQTVQNNRQTGPLWHLSPRYQYLWSHSSCCRQRFLVLSTIQYLRGYACYLLARRFASCIYWINVHIALPTLTSSHTAGPQPRYYCPRLHTSFSLCPSIR